MGTYIHFTDEQKGRANTVDLVELLRQRGEKLLRSGREYRLENDHSITVRGSEWYDHDSRQGGHPVSFVQHYYGMSYQEAMEFLLKGTYPVAGSREMEPPKPFALPPPHQNMRRVYAYLMKQRQIDGAIITHFARKGLLYEDAQYHNCVFVGTDEGGVPRHAHKRSTNSWGKSFKANVEGSRPQYSFHHVGRDNRLYVFEAPIDMLSYISMNPDNWQAHSYVACCGTSPQPVLQMLKPDTKMVYLCLDNDDAGHAASKRVAALLQERGVDTQRLVPELKDWNDDLLQGQQEELAPCLSL